MRKFWLFLLFFVILALVFWFFIRPLLTTQSNIYQGQKLLSDRGAQFLKDQQQQSKEKWLYVDFSNKSKENQVLGTQTVKVKPCYQIEIPFRIKFVRKDKGICNRFISLHEPRAAKVIIYQDERELKSFDEVPDIAMRKIAEQGYLEQELQFNNHSFLVYKKVEGPYEANAFVFDNNKLYVINLITFSNTDFDLEFSKMLQSLQFIN